MSGFGFWCCCEEEEPQHDCGTINAACNTGTAPDTITVTIAGLTGNVGACDCDDMNGEHVLDYVSTSDTFCTYLKTVEFCDEGGTWHWTSLEVRLQNLSAQTRVVVTFYRATPLFGNDFGWIKAVGSPPVDCSNLTVNSFSGVVDNSFCSLLGATVEVET